jgi:hypothetical protein
VSDGATFARDVCFEAEPRRGQQVCGHPLHQYRHQFGPLRIVKHDGGNWSWNHLTASVDTPGQPRGRCRHRVASRQY